MKRSDIPSIPNAALDLALRALSGRADVSFHVGDNESALRDYQTAIDMCPHRIPDMQNRARQMEIERIGILMRATRDYQALLGSIRAIIDRLDRKKSLRLHAHAMRTCGSLYWYMGDYARTLRCYIDSQAAYRILRDRRNAIEMNNNIGLTLQYQGKFKEALAYYARYLDYMQRTGNKPKIASTFGNIGTVYSNLGDAKKALSYFVKDLHIAAAIGYKYEMGSALSNIGICYAMQGKLRKALGYFVQARDIAVAMNDNRSLGININNIGLVHYNTGSLVQANDDFLKKLQISERLGDRHGVCIALCNLVIIAQYRGDLARALEYGKRNLALARGIGSKGAVGPAYSYLGSVLTDLKEYPAARNALRAGDKILRSMNSMFDLTFNSLILSELFYKMRDYREARALADQVLGQSRARDYRKHVVGGLRIKGKILLALGDQRAARACQLEALNIARENGFALEEARSLYELAKIDLARLEHAAGRRCLQEAERIFKKAGADRWLEKIRVTRSRNPAFTDRSH